MTFSRLTLRRLAVEAPENLVLCTTDELIKLADDGGCDPAVRGSSLAELVVRWLLGDSTERGDVRTEMRDIESLVMSVLPGRTLPMTLLRLRMEPSAADEVLDHHLWPTSDAFQRDVERSVRSRLQRLYRQTDGFVPVYDTGDGHASFIPFSLADVVSVDDAAAVDVSRESGTPIAAWEMAARSVLRGSGKRMVVCYRQREDSPPLEGKSFMLPLYVALLKSRGELPAFLPWLMLFTGELSAMDGAVPVATKEKQAGVRARFQKSVRLVAPTDLSYGDEVPCVDPLPAGLKGDMLLEALRARIEALPGCRLSWKYADDRLPVLEEQMRHGTVSRWARQIARVDSMLKIFGPHVRPELHLRLLMLKSAAYCHAGETEKALALNRKAYELAMASGLRYQALRLEIEELVEFQDSQRFDEIFALEKQILSRIEDGQDNIGDEERTDLRMRFFGTMGQVLLECSLLDGDETKAVSSRDLFDRALRCAQKLNRPEEILQDLNYRHLWYAYWQPGGEEEIGAFAEAQSTCGALQTDECRGKNLAYQARQKAIALFMSWKMSGRVSDDWMLLRDPRAAGETWIAASFARMKGALSAAAGDAAAARRIFDIGEKSFPLERWWREEGDVLSSGSVFAQIRLTLLVQAWCSLAKEYPAEAERFRNLAIDLVNVCPNVNNRKNVGALIALLKARYAADPRTLPVFYY